MSKNDNISEIIDQYYKQPSWILNNTINPNMFLYYDKIYIIKLKKSDKAFIGTLVSTDETICNFIDINNDETLSLAYENNEELSSMIILDHIKNTDFTYEIDEIYIVDDYNPIKVDYDDYKEIDFVEETVSKKNYTKRILETDLLSYLIREYDALDNSNKININTTIGKGIRVFISSIIN